MRNRLVVERLHIADVGPCLKQHQPEVFFVAGTPARERTASRYRRQQSPAELGECPYLPRNALQPGGDSERHRVNQHVAIAAGHAPPSMMIVAMPWSG